MADMVNLQSDSLYIGAILFIIFIMVAILSIAGFFSTVHI